MNSRKHTTAPVGVHATGLKDIEALVSELDAKTARLERLTQALRFTQIVSRSEAVVAPEVAARVGGASAVIDGVEMLYERVMADPDLAPSFKSLSEEEMSHLMQQQAKMFLALFGADDYLGRRLADAHHPHNISAAQFEKLMTHVAVVLARLDLTPDEVDAFLTRLRGFRSDIVAPTSDGVPA